ALGYPGAREALAGQRGRRLPQAVAKGRTTERAPGGGSQLRRVTARHEEGCLAIAYYLGRRPHPARAPRAAARQGFEEESGHTSGVRGGGRERGVPFLTPKPDTSPTMGTPSATPSSACSLPAPVGRKRSPSAP